MAIPLLKVGVMFYFSWFITHNEVILFKGFFLQLSKHSLISRKEYLGLEFNWLRKKSMNSSVLLQDCLWFHQFLYLQFCWSFLLIGNYRLSRVTELPDFLLRSLSPYGQKVFKNPLSSVLAKMTLSNFPSL